MSILSQIRGRKTPKESDNKSADKKKEDGPPAAYKHVPTHAASDAITGAPSGNRKQDKTKIREANRNRSAMAAAHSHAQHMGGMASPGSSHNMHSGLSSVTWPSGGTTPMSRKGKEVERGSYFDDISPCTSVRAGPWTVGSSANSIVSIDALEVRPSPRSSPLQRPLTMFEHPHRLHPSSRKSSDASMERMAMANSIKSSNPAASHRDPRPPPSMRGFSSIPPVSRTPSMQVRSLPGTPGSSDSPVFASYSSERSSPRMVSSRRNSMCSMPGLSPGSTRGSYSSPTTPLKTIVVRKAEFALVSPPSPSMDFDFELDNRRSVASTVKPYYHEDHPSPQAIPYADRVFIDSSVEDLDFDLPDTGGDSASSPLTIAHIINLFPEPSSPPSDMAKIRGRKLSLSLSKGGSKLIKKNRTAGSISASPVIS
ncbi:hypothetical protein G7046_g3630 [Stylonectria norvegica]|nr:hypothetical protein G7046_g3630 [Stylonectria norvegica]